MPENKIDIDRFAQLSGVLTGADARCGVTFGIAPKPTPAKLQIGVFIQSGRLL